MTCVRWTLGLWNMAGLMFKYILGWCECISTLLWVCFWNTCVSCMLWTLKRFWMLRCHLKQLMLYSSGVILYDFTFKYFTCGLDCLMNIFEWCGWLGKWTRVWLLEHKSLLCCGSRNMSGCCSDTEWTRLSILFLEECIDAFCLCNCPATGCQELPTLSDPYQCIQWVGMRNAFTHHCLGLN